MRHACAYDFDVIFMDVRMPVMNGVDAFFAIRAIRPQARIVMMTGFKEPFVERAIQAGAEGPLHKPFSVDDMLALIESDERSRPHREGARQNAARPLLITHGPSGTVH